MIIGERCILVSNPVLRKNLFGLRCIKNVLYTRESLGKKSSSRYCGILYCE
ncbi:hypothetical protein CP02DC14_0266 [Chlamydia psittaci 02DC14]|nr:hypothetical protein CP02DC14_0266 [Chlamydia psittaci 02DC14]